MSHYRHLILSEGGAIDDTMPAVTSERRLVGMTVHVSAAPTTSENFVVTLLSSLGEEYSTVLYTLDLSTGSTTDVLYTDFNLPLFSGDAVRTTYTNTDAGTIGVQLILE